jgi:hypothetical protein
LYDDLPNSKRWTEKALARSLRIIWIPRFRNILLSGFWSSRLAYARIWEVLPITCWPPANCLVSKDG